MKYLAILSLLVISICCRADEFHTLIGYVCDTKNDQLVITYDGAYNEEGQAMDEKKRDTQYDPWSLIKTDDDGNVISQKTISATCTLSDGVYKIALSPAPGNSNVGRHCGAWISATALVTKNGKKMYDGGFDNSCFDPQDTIITRVTIKSKVQKPEITTVKHDDFYK